MLFLTDQNINRLDEAAVQRHLDSMPTEHALRIMKMRFLQGRREKVAAYILLVEALRQQGLYGDLPLLTYDTNGKPHLENYPGWEFSMSHCKSAVAVALDQRNAIGIDIEERRHISDAMMRHVCSQEELTSLYSNSDPQEAFIRLWTRKEAYFKCLGTGIVHDIRGIPSPSDLKEKGLKTETYPTLAGYVSICYSSVLDA